MTDLENCVLTVSKRNYDWRPVSRSWPLILPWEEIGNFLKEELGLYEFLAFGEILAPDLWPVTDDMVCLCGKYAGSELHYLLQLGEDSPKTIGTSKWVEWEMWVHPECLLNFFEIVTGGKGYVDLTDWMAYRDDPLVGPVSWGLNNTRSASQRMSSRT